jgi:hypothetical protein
MPDGALENDVIVPEAVLFNDGAPPPAPRWPQVVNGGFVFWFEETSDRTQARTLDGEQRMTRTFQVMTGDPLTSSTVVANFDQSDPAYFFDPACPGAEFNGNPRRRVPQPGDTYVELDEVWNVVFQNDLAVCVDVQVEQADPENLRNWTIKAQFAGVSDPIAQPAEVDWETVPYQEALLVEAEALPPNANPRPILNSAKDPFQEGAPADKDRYTVTITKNVLNYNPVTMQQYQNSLNIATFLAAQHPPGFPAGTCKLKIRARRVRRSGNTDFYWRVTAVIEVDPLGWDLRVRDAGYRYIDPASGKTLNVSRHPLYAGDQAPSTPSLLKPNGDIALPSDTIPDPLIFRRYKRKDWGPIGFLLNY